MSADGMVAVCLGRGDVCEFFRTLESDNAKCVVEGKRHGDPARKLVFTIEDAKRAGLGGDNWNKYPAAMLRARAKSSLARDLFPDLLMGLYDPDEMGGEPVQQVTQTTPIEAEIIPPVPDEIEVEGAIAHINACQDAEAMASMTEMLRDIEARSGGPKSKNGLAIRKAYAARKKALESAPAPVQQREPGED